MLHLLIQSGSQFLHANTWTANTAVLAKLFYMFPESIVLVSDDGYVATPNEDGDFVHVSNLPIWTVTGDSTRQANSAGGTLQMTTPNAYQPRPGKGKISASKWTPTFTTTLSQFQKPKGVRVQEFGTTLD